MNDPFGTIEYIDVNLESDVDDNDGDGFEALEAMPAPLAKGISLESMEAPTNTQILRIGRPVCMSTHQWETEWGSLPPEEGIVARFVLNLPQRLREASLYAALKGDYVFQGIYPIKTTFERGNLSIECTPGVEFNETTFAPFTFGTTLTFSGVPIKNLHGLGESEACWKLNDYKQFPLEGPRIVYGFIPCRTPPYVTIMADATYKNGFFGKTQSANSDLTFDLSTLVK